MALAVVQYMHDAERILRDSSQFKWYTVTLLVLVMYVYAVEVERRRWDIVLAGLAFSLRTGSTRSATPSSRTSVTARRCGR